MEKILLFDIETSPATALVWGGRKYEVDILKFVKNWEVMSVAWKYLGEKKTYCLTAPECGGKDDKRLVREIHKLLTSADIVVGHNAISFDIKKIRARAVFHGMEPIHELSVIDTKRVAKSHFGFDSNSLDDLGEYLKVGRKMKHEGLELWLKCMKGDKKAWANLKSYNKQDVELLEKVYLKLRPSIPNHPSVALLRDHGPGCPHCGSEDITRNGTRVRFKTIAQRWVCHSCCATFLTARKG